METFTQTNNQTYVESGVTFDKEARENYFEMLEQAYVNLALVDPEMDTQEVLVEE
jgi:hypothetical protein